MNQDIHYIAFRVDASHEIGTGHFMRCLTLADALKRKNINIRFVSRHLPPHLKELLRERSLEFIGLQKETMGVEINNLAHDKWLGISQEIDAKDTIQALSDRAWDWIIVDHYSLDIRWEKALRLSAKHIFAIDDLADRKHDCDMLLDDNLLPEFETRYQNKVPAHCRLLLGPKYVPLRNEFLELRKKTNIRTGGVNRILISLGGIDKNNDTNWVIEALKNRKNRHFVIDVVVGAHNPNRKEIQENCRTHSLNCHVQTNQMASLMKDADLAFGAAGFTSYEFVAMKLPAILVPSSHIQIEFANEMEKKGVAYVAKKNKDTNTQAVSEEFYKVIDSIGMRASMSRLCGNVIDGGGCTRIVEELLHKRNNYEHLNK